MKVTLLAASLSIFGGASFAENFDGVYDSSTCKPIDEYSDTRLEIIGDQFNFFSDSCVITGEMESGNQTLISLSCDIEDTKNNDVAFIAERLSDSKLRLISGSGTVIDYNPCDQKDTGSAKTCDLVGSTFQDEMGEIAEVEKIEECFGWFDRGNQIASDGCATYEQRSTETASSNGDIRVVGSRLYHMRYRNENVVFAEHVQFGVPWLVNSVNPEFESDLDWIQMPHETVDKMIGDSFDFTEYGASDGVSGRFSLKKCGAM